MKQFLTFSLLLFLGNFYSQGNLQFNQIISITNGGNINVPVNKIWKIDAINFSETLLFNAGSMNNTSCTTLTSSVPNNRQCFYQGNMLSIGGVTFVTPILSNITQATTCGTTCPAMNPVVLSSSTYYNKFFFPIWLNAGQNISVISGSGILISVVEFNIVP
jgi:hypothetical protein